MWKWNPYWYVLATLAVCCVSDSISVLIFPIFIVCYVPPFFSAGWGINYLFLCNLLVSSIKHQSGLGGEFISVCFSLSEDKAMVSPSKMNMDLATMSMNAATKSVNPVTMSPVQPSPQKN